MEENRDKNGKMKKIRQVLALSGIVILLALYAVTFVAALSSSPAANSLFVISLASTAFVPVGIYFFMWFFKRR